MWAAHDTASSQIYQQRNARLQQQVASTRGGGAAVIDLHGEILGRMLAGLLYGDFVKLVQPSSSAAAAAAMAQHGCHLL